MIGAGGTILKTIAETDLSGEKNEFFACILTDSSSTQYKGDAEIMEAKKKAALKVHEEAGISETYAFNLPDMKLDTVPHVEINRCISEAVRDCQPDFVLTHHHGDLNLDHRRVFESTIVAVRPTPPPAGGVRGIFLYEVASSSEWLRIPPSRAFAPNYYVDVSQYLERKLELLGKYDMEMRPYPHPRSLEGIRILNQARGLEIARPAAEAFEVYRLVA